MVDPLLDVLSDNGGFSRTHALLAGSSAIDPLGLAGAAANDQRNFVRDAFPDIGAYESGIPLLSNNNLTLTQGEVVSIGSSNLSATDSDSLDSALVFNVSSVTHGFFANVADLITPITSFAQSDVSAGNIRFVHDGGELSPAYSVSIFDGVTNTTSAAASISFSGTSDGVLWLSTTGNPGAGSGIPGLIGTALEDDDVLQQAGPNLSLGEASTDGTFSIAFDASAFSGGLNINGMHYVSSAITLGASNSISLQAGDLILTTNANETFVSNGQVVIADLTVSNRDIFYFRPDTLVATARVISIC